MQCLHYCLQTGSGLSSLFSNMKLITYLNVVLRLRVNVSLYMGVPWINNGGGGLQNQSWVLRVRLERGEILFCTCP